MHVSRAKLEVKVGYVGATRETHKRYRLGLINQSRIGVAARRILTLQKLKRNSSSHDGSGILYLAASDTKINQGRDTVLLLVTADTLLALLIFIYLVHRQRLKLGNSQSRA